MISYWILDKHGNPKPAKLMTWAMFFEKTGERIVKQETIGASRVSTVFLGIDHGGYAYGEPPILWETMVFGGPLSDETDRCGGNREQAEAMHEAMVKRVREAEK